MADKTTLLTTPPETGDRRRASWKVDGEPSKRLSVDLPQSLWLDAKRRSLDSNTPIPLSDIARSAIESWVHGELVYDQETGKLLPRK